MGTQYCGLQGRPLCRQLRRRCHRWQFGPSGGWTPAWGDGSVNVTLTEFTWITNRTDIDEVWPYWANHIQYNNGSGRPDFFVTMRIEVTAVPEPGVVLLLLTGAAGAALRRARR